jgi:hypothetical protein
MEKSAPNPTIIATKWGGIYTLTSIVFTYTFQFLNVDQTSPVKYISLIPFIAFLVLAQNEYKTQMNGFIRYGEAFSIGFKYALFGGLILAVFTYIYLAFLSPEILVQSMDTQREKMSSQGMSDSQIDKAMTMGKKYGPIIGAFGGAIFSALFGAIVSLITSAIVKREPSPFDVIDPQEPAV